MLGWGSTPPVSVVPPQEKLGDPEVVVPMLFPAVPAVLACTVTVAPLDDAVTPDAFRLIASRRLIASLVVSVFVAKNVPVLVASAPPLSVPAVQLNPVKALESVMLLPATPAVAAVTVTVVVPLAVARVLPEFLVIVLAMFVPRVPGGTPAAPDQIWKFDPVFTPSVPETCDSVRVLRGKLVSAKPVEPKFVACRVIGFAPTAEVSEARLLGKSLGLVHCHVEELAPDPDIAPARFVAKWAVVSAKTAHLPFPLGAETVPDVWNWYWMLPIVTDGLFSVGGPDAVRVAVSLVGVLAVRVNPFTAIVWPKFALVGVDEIRLEVPVAFVPALAVTVVPLTTTVPVP
jgi:hypothetical protein